MTVAINEPTSLRAGITWQWRREDLGDYPAPTWTLTYYCKRTGAAGAFFSIVATADGTHHAISVAAATNATYVAGTYTWVAVVASGTEKHEVDTGEFEILPRYDVAAALDDRSHARKVLDAIKAVLENRATKDQEEYTIAGRSLKRTPVEQLVALRDRYEREVASEKAAANLANGLGNHPNVLVRL